MASTVNFPYYFSPPPPFHPVPPPPHTIPPPPFHPVPPPPHVSPPPPFHPVPPPPHVSPPPPFHPVPPPPHVTPPPPFHPIIPPPPPSSPDHGPTVIIIVFVSFGCIFFFALCFFALCCLLKRRKKKTVQELETIRVNEHLTVKEAIVEGPHGPQAVVLSIEDDIEEEITKRTVIAKSGDINATGDVEVGESSSNPSVHNTHHNLKH